MGSSFYKNAFLRLDKINNKDIKHHYMVKKKKKERELYCFHTEETVVLTADLLQQRPNGGRQVCGSPGAQTQDLQRVRQICKQAW